MSLPLIQRPALTRLDLLAAPVADALRALPWSDQVQVSAIAPALSDTAQFCETYGVTPQESANCVIIAGKRGADVAYAACVVTAATRADVNGLVRRHLGARRASFGPMDVVTALTGMEYGAITPIGLPGSWPVLVDSLVAKSPQVVIGSGIRGSKLWLPGHLLAELPGALIMPGLGL